MRPALRMRDRTAQIMEANVADCRATEVYMFEGFRV